MAYLPTPQRIRSENCDVVVIGGGPAGSAAALRLARHGLHVIQLERRTFFAPAYDGLRSGEGLLPCTLTELHALGITTAGADWILNAVRSLLIRWRNGRSTQDRFLHRTTITLIEREQFDHALFCAAQRAGVDSRQAWHVRQLSQNEAGVCNGVLATDATGELCRVHARLVVDAGGRNARSITQFGLRSKINGPQFIVVVLYLDALPELHPAQWEMHFFDADQLTVMQVTQLTSGLVRCGMGASLRSKQQMERPETFFWRQLHSCPDLERRLQAGHQVKPCFARAELAYRVRKIALPGLLLVGDATGYLNPLLGDGIWSALHSAAIASDVAYLAYTAGDVSLRLLDEYPRRWEAQRRTRWMIGRLLLHGYKHPGMLYVPAYTALLRRILIGALLRG